MTDPPPHFQSIPELSPCWDTWCKQEADITTVSKPQMDLDLLLAPN